MVPRRTFEEEREYLAWISNGVVVGSQDANLVTLQGGRGGEEAAEGEVVEVVVFFVWHLACGRGITSVVAEVDGFGAACARGVARMAEEAVATVGLGLGR